MIQGETLRVFGLK